MKKYEYRFVGFILSNSKDCRVFLNQAGDEGWMIVAQMIDHCGFYMMREVASVDIG